MRVVNQAPNYQSQLQKLQTPSVKSGGSVFGKQLDIAARRSADSFALENPEAMKRAEDHWETTAYVNLCRQHERWKAQQPPQELPDGQGPTKENMAYLKDHYSGELSWVERMDMLDTMMEMGVIDREQRNQAWGDTLIVITPDMSYEEECAIMAEATQRFHIKDLDEYFSDAPVVDFKTADDVFAWLGQVLDGEK